MCIDPETKKCCGNSKNGQEASMDHMEEGGVWVQAWRAGRLRPQALVHTWSHLQFYNFLQLLHEGRGGRRTPLGLEGGGGNTRNLEEVTIFTVSMC